MNKTTTVQPHARTVPGLLAMLIVTATRCWARPPSPWSAASERPSSMRRGS